MVSATSSFYTYLLYAVCCGFAIHSSYAFTSPCIKTFHRLNEGALKSPFYNPSPIFMSEDAPVAENDVKADQPKPAVKCPNCDLCDGSGRILGGIGVIAPWWPIKAYRPCPNFINSGGNYVRSGQGLDEIAFGRGRLDDEE